MQPKPNTKYQVPNTNCYLLIALLVRNLIEIIEHQPPFLGIKPVGRHRAVHYVFRERGGKVGFLIPVFEQSPENQDHRGVANNQNTLLPAFARHGSQETMHPQRHIGTALSTRRTVPVFPFALPPFVLRRIRLLHALGREPVESAELNLADPLLLPDGERSTEAFSDAPRGLHRAKIGRRKNKIEIVFLGKTLPRLPRLLPPPFSQRNIHIPQPLPIGVSSRFGKSQPLRNIEFR